MLMTFAAFTMLMTFARALRFHPHFLIDDSGQVIFKSTTVQNTSCCKLSLALTSYTYRSLSCYSWYVVLYSTGLQSSCWLHCCGVMPGWTVRACRLRGRVDSLRADSTDGLESHPRAQSGEVRFPFCRVFELSRKQWQEGFSCVHRSRPCPGGEMAWSVAPIPNSSGVGVPHGTSV
jgi:hypothetical protein